MRPRPIPKSIRSRRPTRCRPIASPTLTRRPGTSPAWNKPTDPTLEERFKRVKAKLRGYVNEPEATLRIYPATDQSIYAHYARAYAYHKSGYPEQAAAETDRAGRRPRPTIPISSRSKGQILLESGKPAEALGAAARGDRSVEQPAADRRDLRPRADRDRGQGQSRRSRDGAAQRGRARQGESLCLVCSSAPSMSARATSRAPRLPLPSART